MWPFATATNKLALWPHPGLFRLGKDAGLADGEKVNAYTKKHMMWCSCNYFTKTTIFPQQLLLVFLMEQVMLCTLIIHPDKLSVVHKCHTSWMGFFKMMTLSRQLLYSYITQIEVSQQISRVIHISQGTGLRVTWHKDHLILDSIH